MRLFLLLPMLLTLPWLLDLVIRVKHREHDPSQTVVLVTGASRGVGHGLTLHLASRGVLVIAGVRSQSDLKVFAGVPNVRPLLLDVATQAHLDSALSEVTTVLQSSGRSFGGIVANAAIQFQAPCESETDDHERKTFEVNYFGTVRLVRKFLPLLMAQQSRVLIVGSSGAILPMPFLSSYVATKAALKAYASSLRSEVESQGVAVTYILLGGVKTDMLAAGTSAGIFNGTKYAEIASRMDRVVRQAEPLFVTPEQVAPELANLVFTPYPPCTAYVGLDSKFGGVMSMLPQRLIHALA